MQFINRINNYGQFIVIIRIVILGLEDLKKLQNNNNITTIRKI